MIEIQDKTFSLFQRAVAARRLILFPAVEKVCKKTAAVNFLAGTISTPTERNKLALNRLLRRHFMSRAVFLYRCRSHRSFRKNLRRTFRFEKRFGYIVRQ